MLYNDLIQAYMEKEIDTLKSLNIERIDKAINLIRETFENKKTIYIFGNGGSSATATHFANDFNKGISEWTEKKFNFICLNDNTPTLMAIANDIGFEEVFRFQLRGRLNPGDIVIAISGSGNSKNIIKACEYAKSLGNKIIGLTGFSGGKLGTLCDIHLNAPVQNMQIAEDIHLFFNHLIMSVFYKTL